MYCPHCHYQMVTIQRAMNEKEGMTLRIYECKKCEWKGVIETRETICRSSTTKEDRAKQKAVKLKTAMKQVAKDMRSMTHESLNDLEKQALKFAAGWIDRRNANGV